MYDNFRKTDKQAIPISPIAFLIGGTMQIFQGGPDGL